MASIGGANINISSLGWSGDRQAYIARLLKTPAESADSVREATFDMTQHAPGTPPPERTGKPLTEEEANANVDAAESLRLRTAASTDGWRTYVLQFTDGYKPQPDGSAPLFISAAAQALDYVSQKRIEFAPRAVGALTAVNVDAVLKHADEPGGVDPRIYARYVKEETDGLKSSSGTFLFQGAMGTDHVTTDVDEYLGWLNDAISARAAAKGETVAPLNDRSSNIVAIVNGTSVTLDQLKSMAAQSAQLAAKPASLLKPDTTAAKQPLTTPSAVNVDEAKKLDEQGVNATSYGDYIKSQSEILQASGQDFLFIGAFGSNRVTHSVDEYLGWLSESVSKRAAAKARSNAQTPAKPEASPDS